MTNLDDLDLRPDEPEPEPPGATSRRPPLALIAVATAVLVGAGLWYGLLRKRPKPAAPPPAAPSTIAPATPTPKPTPLDLPALDASDAIVRQLVGPLSAHRLFASWLETPNLVRTLTASAVNLAEGGSPRAHLGFLAPQSAFAVAERGGRTVIDSASYQRYDAFAASVSSLDPAAGARVYGQLEPLFDIAYRELGYPRGRFREVLARGLEHLLDAPVVDGDVEVKAVRRAALVYELADPELEALSPAQKHLLRMGPANVRRLQATLRGLRDGLKAEEAGAADPQAPR
jgi:hypothetical protein